MTVSFLPSLRSLCGSLRVYGQPFQLARILDRLEILDSKHGVAGTAPKVARLGSTVRVEDLCYRGQAELLLMPSGKANPDRGWISVFSPLGAALLGSKVGDIAKVDLGGMEYRFLLVEILATAEMHGDEKEGGSAP
ncbi:GreA/GreB family elongation factor [Kineobactrum salinum]|uniref:GreA/GreB family elongation factor n=1 Tax=Kineobactrum salinum TaxID=2708301 RepID=A0A6C0U2W1_9GAMM|nr:GreA/GreB family elongation factor [Kineobactrum salinum]QIB65307.1 GreA/GreB family elongation factor [Kineobactrum salinum]